LPSDWHKFCYSTKVIVEVTVRAIAFHLDARSGIPTYLQLVQQVKHAVRYAMLRPGDRLPTAREVVEDLAINPNTVLKAYRELERGGFVHSRPGAGTFVSDGAPAPLARSVHEPLRRSIDRWLGQAHAAGLDRESVIALFTLALQAAYGSEDTTHARRA
jgi:DNA-binding transcriptional regulator YhcF (GntR family)